jgi:hypothetical protein
MLRLRCWLFAIGSSLFAIGTAPGFAMVGGAGATNLLCFIGSWFFTSAALIQLLLSRPSISRSCKAPSIRAEWLSAATQFVGTPRFNQHRRSVVGASNTCTQTLRVVAGRGGFGRVPG